MRGVDGRTTIIPAQAGIHRDGMGAQGMHCPFREAKGARTSKASARGMQGGEGGAQATDPPTLTHLTSTRIPRSLR